MTMLRRRRPPSMVLSVELDPVGGGAGDVVFRLGDFESIGDGHHLARDDAVAGESVLSASRALGLLLRKWIDVIETVPPGTTRYVPFAFFDDGTGWLRLNGRDFRNVAVRPGWASIPGRSFHPTAFSTVERQMNTLSMAHEAPEIEIDRVLLVAQIVTSIHGLPHHRR
ncbi:MAG: hypothetical protein ACFCVK_07325 [Acidimicrobiales bacterium]